MKYLLLILALLCSGIAQASELSYDQAMSLASKENKKVLLYFGTNWCKYCNKMNQHFKDEYVEHKLSNFIVLKINLDKNPELKNKFSVGSIPDYMILDSKEKVLKRNKGFIEKDNFIKWLED